MEPQEKWFGADFKLFGRFGAVFMFILIGLRAAVIAILINIKTRHIIAVSSRYQVRGLKMSFQSLDMDLKINHFCVGARRCIKL